MKVGKKKIDVDRTVKQRDNVVGVNVEQMVKTMAHVKMDHVILVTLDHHVIILIRDTSYGIWADRG